jgi:catechol 2,3-dioxygenase-like lactoylglutathione lyase family enzyme
MAVTKIDHIELIVNRFEEYVALFRALGFQERLRTKHHGDSVEFQLPGENQPVFEIHRVGGEEAIGVNHIAFQVPDVAAARKELQAQGINNANVEPVYVRATGRTVLNLRDPDGWRLQIVDSARKAPDLTSAH